MSVATVAGADGVPAEPTALAGTTIAATTDAAIAAIAGSGVMEGATR